MNDFEIRSSRLRRLAGTALLVAALAGCAAGPSTPVAPSKPSAAPNVNPAPIEAAAEANAAPVDLEPGFARWVGTLYASGRAAGIDEGTLQRALDGLHYLPRVVELDRSQPEFTRTIWAYLDIAASPQRVALGREKLRQFRTEADAAAARFGVPPEFVVAIWGVESNYGGNVGSFPTLDALATLGFEGRRGEWAREQMIAALRILQSGDITRAQMVGSWAGAMGQTQFLPTVFLAYAVDADGDGRRDIWGSMADVMASTANFIAHSGWQPGQPWGAEVRLPSGFDVGRAVPAVRQSTAQWAAEGVATLDGAPLPQISEGAILLPAGARGPAFLVGPNFGAILRYNNATSYALAVCLLAQQVAGGPGVQSPWPRELAALTRAETLALQTALNARGFASGAPDGIMGPATGAALRAYQRSIGLPADGYPTLDLLQRVQAR